MITWDGHYFMSLYRLRDTGWALIPTAASLFVAWYANVGVAICRASLLCAAGVWIVCVLTT